MTKQPLVNVAISREQREWIQGFLDRHPEFDIRSVPEYCRMAINRQVEKDKAREEGRYLPPHESCYFVGSI
jgi:hypothetical protein